MDLAGNIALGTGQRVFGGSLAAEGTNRLVIDNTGRVGIGTATPAAGLHVAGSVLIGGALGVTGNATVNGTVLATGANVGNASIGSLGVTGGAARTNNSRFWDTPSDARLKQNIEPVTGALGKMLALRGVTFEWKDPKKMGDRPGPHMGMIGQEVEKVFPEWVSKNDQGIRILNMEGLDALTVESFRELQQQNDQLRARLEAQKKELQALKKQVEGTGRRP